jgi:UvrD-like helicase family protein
VHVRRGNGADQQAMAIVDSLQPRPSGLARRIIALLLARTAKGWRVFLPRDGSKIGAPDVIAVGSTGVFVIKFADRLPDNGDVQALIDHVDKWSCRIRAGSGSEVLASSAVHEAVVVPEGTQLTGIQDRRVEVVSEGRVSSWLRTTATSLPRHPRDHVARQLDTLLPHYTSHSVDPPQAPVPAEGLLDSDALQADQLEMVQGGPFEQWMTFLHSDQQQIVTRQYSGPARISGPAGTGKTVVALHRLRHLARRSTGPLLFTTFVRTLPAVHEATFRRLAPEFDERVEFVNLHGWARSFLWDRGIKVTIDQGRVNTAFSTAWKAHRALLAPIETNPGYWQTEIGRVIKGRGLGTFDDYRRIDRTGRTVSVSRHQQRRLVWDLHEAYQQNLREKNLVDYDDMISMALAEVTTNPLETQYSAVVVDEVQDMTLTGLRLLRELAGDGPDGLLLVGDGQQQVYPGGWRLSDAGIPIQGRGAVLRINYRNRAELLAFAQRFDARNTVDDLDGATGTALQDVEVANPGGSHRTWQGTWDQLESALTAAIKALPPTRGATAIIAFTKHDVDACLRILRAAGISFVRLEDYKGEVDQTIKIGTVHRAKGLDFQHVLVVDSDHGLATTATTTAAAAEQQQLRSRQRLVAATRARDSLWWGTVR